MSLASRLVQGPHLTLTQVGKQLPWELPWVIETELFYFAIAVCPVGVAKNTAYLLLSLYLVNKEGNGSQGT